LSLRIVRTSAIFRQADLTRPYFDATPRAMQAL